MQDEHITQEQQSSPSTEQQATDKLDETVAINKNAFTRFLSNVGEAGYALEGLESVLTERPDTYAGVTFAVAVIGRYIDLELVELARGVGMGGLSRAVKSKL